MTRKSLNVSKPYYDSFRHISIKLHQNLLCCFLIKDLHWCEDFIVNTAQNVYTFVYICMLYYITVVSVTPNEFCLTVDKHIIEIQ